VREQERHECALVGVLRLVGQRQAFGGGDGVGGDEIAEESQQRVALAQLGRVLAVLRQERKEVGDEDACLVDGLEQGNEDRRRVEREDRLQQALEMFL
jgi:hypothetical protein